MRHTTFNAQPLDWKGFFLEDAKPLDLQFGGTYFIGDPYQRGYGIGSIFRSLYRFLLPLGKVVGREGLAFGGKVLDDIAKGQNPKEALVKHGSESLGNLLTKSQEKLKQSGSGKRKKRVRIVGRTVTKALLPPKKYKRKSIDIFQGLS